MNIDELNIAIKKSDGMIAALAETIFEQLSKYYPDLNLSDCHNYTRALYQGYMTEIKTIYGQLQSELGYKIEPAPDRWDRLYNVDFFIKINDKYIGLQIKPVNQGIQLSQIFKEKKLQSKTHEKFEKEFGGKVFYIFSSNSNGKKVIMNPEIIEELRKEIIRLS